ncbi:MAG TPA: DUF192 domain-containing protein [Kofleriaceae bacterium]|nr:DUF192 domain-containing protein [Kofleriaceae bacterium]
MRFVLIAVLACVACSNGAKREDAPMPPKNTAPGDSQAPQQPANQPKVYVSSQSGEVAVNVEVVATEAKIERGLMYRQALALDAGMLFMMGHEKKWSFWMRNTLIPLDMLFIGKDKVVVGIVENAEPKTETLREVSGPSLYVLEVNGGWAKQHKVEAGAKVRFENVTE